jgi:hypothetical protein
MFNFLGKCRVFTKAAMAFYIPGSSVCGFHFTYPCQHLNFCCFARRGGSCLFYSYSEAEVGRIMVRGPDKKFARPHLTNKKAGHDGMHPPSQLDKKHRRILVHADLA